MSDQESVSKAAEEQNRKAQEAAQAQIKKDEEKRLQAMRDAVGDTSTKPLDFATAAKETEEREQPPNPFNTKELEQKPSGTQPPARNVNPRTLPDDLKAENVPTNEGAAPSPSTQTKK